MEYFFGAERLARKVVYTSRQCCVAAFGKSEGREDNDLYVMATVKLPDTACHFQTVHAG